MPLRQRLPSYTQNKMILSLIQDEQRNPSQDVFPSKNACTRVVGLGFGTDMTRRFRNHQKRQRGDFSKGLLEISKINKTQDALDALGTNSQSYSVKVCGRNGKFSSGMDYIASVLRINHYVGLLESYKYMDRGGGKERRGLRNIVGFKKRNERYSPAEEEPDDRIVKGW